MPGSPSLMPDVVVVAFLATWGARERAEWEEQRGDVSIIPHKSKLSFHILKSDFVQAQFMWSL